MIKAVNIRYSYTETPLFEKGNFTVGEGMKVGLVGQNGAGKSTLFNLIRGKVELDGGTIDVEGSVTLVPQEVKFDPDMEASKTIREYVDPHFQKEDFEIIKMMNGLEIESLALDASPQKLSGGQKTKLALIRALFKEPDILLLDEPTNFLDIEGKQWVMNFLSQYPKTLILISHDLKLLDKYIDKVIVIDAQKKEIEEYTGNYTSFIRIKKERDDLLKRKIMSEKKHIAQMKKGLLKMERYRSEKGMRRKIQLKRRIEKLEVALPEMPPEIRKIKFKLLEPARIGEVPLIIKNICKSYDDKEVLLDVSFSIKRYERVALIGPNGVGKSTLIKIIMNALAPDQGTVLLDDKIKVGYYSQEFETFDMDSNIIDFVNNFTRQNESILRPILARFLFMGDKIYQKIGTLSGGEKTRLSIAMLFMKDFNFLILDEPTTYLDPLSQRVILEAIKQYQGTLLVVSHTEDFIKELNPAKVLLLPENKFIPWTSDLVDKVSEI